MTASFSEPASSSAPLRVHGPEQLVAAIPYLVGFEPAQSLVVLCLRGERRTVALTCRIDVPETPAEQQELHDTVAHAVRASSASDVAFAVYSDSADAQIILRDVIEHSPVPVRDALVVQAGRWRSVLCCDTECCPAEGNTVSEQVADEVRAVFVADGVAPAHGREHVVQAFAPVEQTDPSREQLVIELDCLTSELLEETAEGASWRKDMLEVSWALCTSDGEWFIRDRAAMVIALQDIGVRDALLRRLMATSDVRFLEERMRSVARCTPEELAAPVYTVTGALAWQHGDGARACIALRFALEANPDYSLANLLYRAIQAGMPPSRWRMALEATTEEICLAGAEAA